MNEAQRANRNLLQRSCGAADSINNRSEWWHYTRGAEPYPGTFFDFPVE